MTVDTFLALVTFRGIYGTTSVNIRFLRYVYVTFFCVFLKVIECLKFSKRVNEDTHYHKECVFFKRKALFKSLILTVLVRTDPKLLPDVSEWFQKQKPRKKTHFM